MKKIILLICILALSGCENIRTLHPDKLSSIKKIAVITKFGDQFEMQSIGFTVFQNTYSRVVLEDYSFNKILESEAIEFLSELGYEGKAYDDPYNNIKVSYNPLLITDTRKLGDAPNQLLEAGFDILIVIDEYLHNRGDQFPRNEVGLRLMERGESQNTADLYAHLEFSIYDIPAGKRIFYNTGYVTKEIKLDTWPNDFHGFSEIEKDRIINESINLVIPIIMESIKISLSSEPVAGGNAAR